MFAKFIYMHIYIDKSRDAFGNSWSPVTRYAKDGCEQMREGRKGEREMERKRERKKNGELKRRDQCHVLCRRKASLTTIKVARTSATWVPRIAAITNCESDGVLLNVPRAINKHYHRRHPTPLRTRRRRHRS